MTAHRKGAIFFSIIVIALLCSYGVLKIIEYQRAQQALLTSQQGALTNAQRELENLARQVSSTEADAQRQIAIEKEATVANKQTSVSEIIQEWRPRIARVECYWYNSRGSLSQVGWGSGLLVYQGSMAASPYVIYTNRHVVSDPAYGAPQSCTITFPGTQESYSVPNNQIGTDSYASGSFDFAIIFLSNPGAYVKANALSIRYKSNVSAGSYCRGRGAVGNSLVILGYPAIGSQTDITATEGIISGYDEYYYVTSAKVEHGDSGGAAISLNDDCYLGIPSWAEAGSIESLARVLDFNYIYTHSQ